MRIKGTRSCVLVAAFLCGTFAYGAALLPDNAISVDTGRKSVNSDASAVITFYNNLSYDVDLYWINFDGDRVFYRTIGANSSHAQPTYITHPWLLVKKGTGGTAAQGTGELIAAFSPFTRNPSGPKDGDTATIGAGTGLSTSLFPSSFTFAGFQGGPSQYADLEIGANRPGQPFTISTEGSWLKVSATSGTTPAIVSVEADPFALPPNASYPGRLFVNAPGASPSQVAIPVTFGVGNPKPPQLAVSPTSITMDIYTGQTQGHKWLRTRNAGSGTLGPIQVGVESFGGAAFTVFPPTITAGTIVAVNATTSDSGTHTGNVLFYQAGQLILKIPIVQQSVPPTIVVSPSTVYIGGLPPDLLSPVNPVSHTIVRPLTISRYGGTGPATYRATGNPPWVTANPPSGSFVGASTPVALELKFGALAQGGYYGTLAVSDGVTPNQNVAHIVVEVTNAPPKPSDVERESYSPLIPDEHGSEVFKMTANSLVEKPVQITADYGDGPVFFEFKRLPTTPPADLRGPRYPVEVSLANPLPPPGVYVGKVILTYENFVNAWPVMAIIPPGIGLSASRAAVACTPARMIPAVHSPLDNFSQKTAWPTALTVVVADDCGNLDNAGDVIASFSNGDPALSMNPAGPGLWVATWVGQKPDEHVAITFTAISKDGKLSGSASLLGSLALNPLNPPLISDGGIVNGASFATGGTLAPGSFVSIFGTGLADRQLSAPSVPLPNTLAGASVEINGINAPVFFASDGQVNAILPYGISVDRPSNVMVKRGDAWAVSRSVRITPAAPGIFAYGDQLGIVVGVSAGGAQALADSVHPVTAQQVIVAYATGLGEVSPAVKAGTQTPLSPLSRTVAPVTMTIGGVAARVDFAGLTPGSTGLYQINAVVPAGVTPGSRVPVVVKAADQSSAPVYISVR